MEAELVVVSEGTLEGTPRGHQEALKRKCPQGTIKGYINSPISPTRECPNLHALRGCGHAHSQGQGLYLVVETAKSGSVGKLKYLFGNDAK